MVYILIIRTIELAKIDTILNDKALNYLFVGFFTPTFLGFAIYGCILYVEATGTRCVNYILQYLIILVFRMQMMDLDICL
jgi:hypothetical protein